MCRCKGRPTWEEMDVADEEPKLVEMVAPIDKKIKLDDKQEMQIEVPKSAFRLQVSSKLDEKGVQSGVATANLETVDTIGCRTIAARRCIHNGNEKRFTGCGSSSAGCQNQLGYVLIETTLPSGYGVQGVGEYGKKGPIGDKIEESSGRQGSSVGTTTTRSAKSSTDMEIFSKIHYHGARRLRALELMCTTQSLPGAHQVMNYDACEELGTRAGPVKAFYDKQNAVNVERLRLGAKLIQQEEATKNQLQEVTELAKTKTK